MRFRRAPTLRHRYLGNILIAVGALLPGIGGSLTRAGMVEALYVTELAGLLLIFAGYRKCITVPVAVAGSAEPAPRRPVAAAVLLSALLLPAWVVAETVGPAEESHTEAAEAKEDGEMVSLFSRTTVTATGSRIQSFDVSTPVSIIRGREIERLAPDSAADLLRYQPGVDVNGVGPNQTRPVIRGQRGLRVLFLQDGLRMNNPRRQTDFGEIPGLVDTESMESVEVVRGPASVLYGSDAIGGVLNLIPKSPGYRGAGSMAGSFVALSRSAGDQWKGQGTVEGRWHRTSLQLGGSVRDASDYNAPAGGYGDIRLAGDTPVIDSGVEDESLYGYLGQQLGESQELFLRFQHYSAKETGFGFVEPETLGEVDPFRIRILYPFQEFDRLTAGYIASTLDTVPADSLEVKAYYQANERRLANDIDIDLGSSFPGTPSSTLEADSLNFTDLATFGVRAQAIKLAGQRHLITYGAEFCGDDSRNTDRSVTKITFRFPFPPFEVPIVTSDDVANTPNAVNESYGIFVQDEIDFGDSLKMTFGARMQNVATKAEATPGWSVSGLDFDDDSLVGSVGLVYAVSSNLRLVGSYGTAFRSPNIVERLFNGPTPEGAGFQILNPDLTSEESDNTELGLKYMRPNAVFELLVFRNDIDRGIVQYFFSPEEVAQLPQELQDRIVATQAQFVVQQRNIDRLRWDGVEMVIGYRAGDGFSVGANYTYLDGERVDSERPPTGDAVTRKGTLRLRWEPPRSRYWTEYRLRHNGSQRAVLDPDEPVPPVGEVLPSFTIHSLAGGLRLSATGRVEHSVAVAIDNLTDELYAEFSNATFFRPQPGRSLTASYRLRF
jgi:outer membrane receptor protein involved in Fe transport